jgi:citrate synthase
VRSEPSGHGRARRHRRDDLERLKARDDARAGHSPVAAGVLRRGEPVLESAVTALDAEGLGVRAASLSALLPRGAHPLAALASAVPAWGSRTPGAATSASTPSGGAVRLGRPGGGE